MTTRIVKETRLTDLRQDGEIAVHFLVCLEQGAVLLQLLHRLLDELGIVERSVPNGTQHLYFALAH